MTNIKSMMNEAPELTQEAAALRNLLASSYSIHAVMDRPMHKGYLPDVLPDGALRLGEHGVTDFLDTFGNTSIDPRKLLVGYCVIRRELGVIQQTDKQFGADLQALAADASDADPLLRTTSSQNPEDLLIGLAAVRIGQTRLNLQDDQGGPQKNLIPIISGNAGDRMDRLSTKAPQEQREVLGHFAHTLRSEAHSKKLLVAVMKAAKRRIQK